MSQLPRLGPRGGREHGAVYRAFDPGSGLGRRDLDGFGVVQRVAGLIIAESAGVEGRCCLPRDMRNLLRHMGQLVGDQPDAFPAAGRELPCREGNVVLPGIGTRIDIGGGGRRPSMRMQAHIGKIPPETRFEIGALLGGERHAAGSQGIGRSLGPSPARRARRSALFLAMQVLFLLGLASGAFALDAERRRTAERAGEVTRGFIGDNAFGRLVGLAFQGIVDRADARLHLNARR